MEEKQIEQKPHVSAIESEDVKTVSIATTKGHVWGGLFETIPKDIFDIINPPNRIVDAIKKSSEASPQMNNSLNTEKITAELIVNIKNSIDCMHHDLNRCQTILTATLGSDPDEEKISKEVLLANKLMVEKLIIEMLELSKKEYVTQAEMQKIKIFISGNHAIHEQLQQLSINSSRANIRQAY